MPVKLLIFGEDEDQRRRLRESLRAEDFTVYETADVLEAVRLLKSEDIGIVLASRHMNGVEKGEFRELIEKYRRGVSILFTGEVSSQNMALGLGDLGKFLISSARTRTSLEREIRDLKQVFFSFASRLLQVFEANDRYFFNNSHRVADLSVRTARRMGLREDFIESLSMAALLKDLGYVGIHEQLLTEKKFDSRELTPIKKHPLNTVQILRELNFPWDVESMISHHHEQWDGAGYPAGLRGKDISLGARIIGIADTFVAMTTDRPYRKALPREKALQEIEKKAGSQFDPEIAGVFLLMMRETPVADRRPILLIERKPAISPLLRLSVNLREYDIVSASSSFEAVSFAKQRAPELVIADVDILDGGSFQTFYNTLRQISGVKKTPFIFIVPDRDYPRSFKGNRLHYVVKPVDMGELSLAVMDLLGLETAPRSATSAQAPSCDIRGLSGAIEDFGLADVVQILSLGHKTAKVEVVNGTLNGVLYLHNGRVVHASAGGLKGKDAFFELIGWKKGMFFILHNRTTDDPNIGMDTMHLLLETARVLDEGKLL